MRGPARTAGPAGTRHEGRARGETSPASGPGPGLLPITVSGAGRSPQRTTPTQPSRQVARSHPDTRTAPTWGPAPPSSRANAEASTDRVRTFLAPRMRTEHALALAPSDFGWVSRLRSQVSPMRAGGGTESSLEMGEGCRRGRSRGGAGSTRKAEGGGFGAGTGEPGARGTGSAGGALPGGGGRGGVAGHLEDCVGRGSERGRGTWPGAPWRRWDPVRSDHLTVGDGASPRPGWASAATDTHRRHRGLNGPQGPGV